MDDDEPRIFIGKNFTLFIEEADGREFVPITPPVSHGAPPLSFPQGDIEITGTFTFNSWVDRWKLSAWLQPPL